MYYSVLRPETFCEKKWKLSVNFKLLEKQYSRYGKFSEIKINLYFFSIFFCFCSSLISHSLFQPSPHIHLIPHHRPHKMSAFVVKLLQLSNWNQRRKKDLCSTADDWKIDRLVTLSKMLRNENKNKLNNDVDTWNFSNCQEILVVLQVAKTIGYSPMLLCSNVFLPNNLYNSSIYYTDAKT